MRNPSKNTIKRLKLYQAIFIKNKTPRKLKKKDKLMFKAISDLTSGMLPERSIMHNAMIKGSQVGFSESAAFNAKGNIISCTATIPGHKTQYFIVEKKKDDHKQVVQNFYDNESLN